MLTMIDSNGSTGGFPNNFYNVTSASIPWCSGKEVVYLPANNLHSGEHQYLPPYARSDYFGDHETECHRPSDNL